jgi:hypothetical protein
MIARLETSNIKRINKIEDYQQYDAMARYILLLQNFWHKNRLKQSYD